MKKVLILFVHLIACTIYAQVPGGDLLMGLHQIESADISNISNPIEGTIFYNATEKQIYVYNGSAWAPISEDSGWAIDGNSISTTDFIGSTNNQDLVFKTNNEERMRLQNDGNVGIGTSSPNYKLEVNGPAKIEDTPTITTATKALVKDPSSGQISEQEINSFTINGKYSINFAGRAQFFSTLWHGPHNQYGVAHQNWNAAKTNAVTPAYSTDDQFGVPIASNVTLAKFSMKNDFNVVPTTPSINLGVIRNGVVINIGTYEITNPSTSITIQTTDVGFPLLEGDLLVWATKSAAGGNSYSYASLTFEFTY